jgi:hypothetical protein
MVCAMASSPFKGDPRDINVAGSTVDVMIASPVGTRCPGAELA